jgi:hypothetical protein
MPHIPGHITAGNAFQDYTDPAGLWSEVLKGFEPAQYYSSPAGMAFGARSPRRQRYFQHAFQDVLKDYYGTAGTAMRQGQAPATFMEFLDPQSSDGRLNPWTSRYASLPQTARGVTGQAYNPRTRFLFNY